jgi:hypothetical protein
MLIMKFYFLLLLNIQMFNFLLFTDLANRLHKMGDQFRTVVRIELFECVEDHHHVKFTML